MKPKRPSLRSLAAAIGVVGLLLVTLLAVFGICFTRAYISLAPRGTLHRVLAEHPSWHQVFRIEIAGTTYYKVVGENAYRSIVVPSGQPVYVFDTSGHLVEWIYDEGETDGFRTRWGPPIDGVPVSQSEIDSIRAGTTLQRRD